MTLAGDVIVLAGGLGTRLRSEVPDLPKPMAPVAGKPFLEHILERLCHQGARRIVLSVGYRGEAIISHFGSQYRNVELAYAREETPLGTGGAIAFALASTHTRHVLVVNGDTYLDMDYCGFFERCQEADTRLGIAVRHVDDTSRYGRCEVDQGVITQFSEKGVIGPGFINAGVYCLRNDAMNNRNLPAKFSFEQDFVSCFLDDLRPIAYPVSGYFIDIGIPEDFRRAQIDFDPTHTARIREAAK